MSHDIIHCDLCLAIQECSSLGWRLSISNPTPRRWDVSLWRPLPEPHEHGIINETATGYGRTARAAIDDALANTQRVAPKGMSAASNAPDPGILDILNGLRATVLARPKTQHVRRI